jgi:hypothetical protein
VLRKELIVLRWAIRRRAFMQSIWVYMRSWFENDDHEQLVWHRKPLSVIALYVFMGFLGYWEFRVPSPGKAVTALAVAAAAMSIRGEMRGKEKAAWMLLLFALLAVELRSIDDDRLLHDQEFGAITTGLQTTIKASDDIRLNQIREFEKLMNEDKDLRARTTGGDTYFYFRVEDPIAVNNVGDARSNAYPTARGAYMLPWVHTYCMCPSTAVPQQIEDYSDFSPTEAFRERRGIFLPLLKARSKQLCIIGINTSNGAYVQDVLFIRQGNGWVWESQLFRGASKKPFRQTWGKGFPKNQVNELLNEWYSGKN